MSLADRFFYMGGRIMSTAGRVGAFTPPAIMPKTMDRTGPFQTRPTRKQTGFVEYGEISLRVWSDADLTDLLKELQQQGVEQQLCVYGWDTDAIGAQVDMAQVLRLSAAPKSEPASDTEYEVTGVPDDNGVRQGVSLHAMEAEDGDGNTQGSPVDNGFAAAAVNIASNSVANPTVVTTATAHGLQTGDTVTIASHTGSTPAINGNHTVTVLSPTTFSVAVNVTVGGGASGTVRRTSTRGGGIVDLHVKNLDRDGASALQVTTVDSVDGAVWTSLGAFSAIAQDIDGTDPTAGESERIEIAASAVIDRYTALVWDFTGSPGGNETATLAAFLARNE